MNTDLQNIVEEGDIIISNPTSEGTLSISTQFQANGISSLNGNNNVVNGVISQPHTKKSRHKISVAIPNPSAFEEGFEVAGEESTFEILAEEEAITSQEADLISELQECNIEIDVSQLSQDMQAILSHVKDINQKHAGNDIEITAQVVKYLVQPETQNIINRYTEVVTTLTADNIRCLTGMSNQKMCALAQHGSASLAQIPDLADLNKIIKLYGGPMKKLILWSLDQIRNLMEECDATLDGDKLKQLEELYVNVVDLLNIKPKECPVCPPCPSVASPAKEEEESDDESDDEEEAPKKKSKSKKIKHILDRTLVDLNKPVNTTGKWIKNNKTFVIIIVMVILIILYQRNKK